MQASLVNFPKIQADPKDNNIRASEPKKSWLMKKINGTKYSEIDY